MELRVLVEDRTGHPACRTEHGLSLLITYQNTTLLLDCGQSTMFRDNAQALDINLDDVPLMVLSHGHYDHGGGLKSLAGKKIYCHPDCFRKRYAKRNPNSYAGLPVSRDALCAQNKLILTSTSCTIAQDIHFLTAIPRNFSFEATPSPTVLEDGSEDKLLDDSGIAINTPKGIIVITGCAHAGICNCIEHAKRICKNDTIYAIIGGFHLRDTTANLDQVISYLQDVQASQIITGHCTCDAACDILQQRLAGTTHVHILGSGNSYLIE